MVARWTTSFRRRYEHTSAWLAGIAIVGPIAASISTVSSLLISSSSSIIKDMYMHYSEKRGRPVEDTRISTLSRIFTYAVGIIVLVIAIAPPDVIWKINMFAFGGLETAFAGCSSWGCSGRGACLGCPCLDGRRRGSVLHHDGDGFQALRPASDCHRSKPFACAHACVLVAGNMARQAAGRCRPT